MDSVYLFDICILPLLFVQVLSLVSQFLLLRYGAKYSSDLGFAFAAFVTASSASLLSSAVLLFAYLVSTKTLRRVRSSLYVRESSICDISCDMFLGDSDID